MNEWICYGLRTRFTVIAMGLAMLLCNGVVHAEGTGEKFTPSLLSPSEQENQAALNQRLRTAKHDVEAFQLFAEHFRDNGDMKTLAQLQKPVDDYLKRHLDNLLIQNPEYSTLEATRLTAELMFMKARLLLSLSQRDAAKSTVAEMKKRFSSYQKILVELPGKTTTLDEAMKLLNDDLTKIATTEKK